MPRVILNAGLQPETPENLIPGVQFGDGDIGCSFVAPEGVNPCVFFSEIVPHEIGEPFAPEGAKLPDIPRPFFVMMFKNAESVDIVINMLQAAKEKLTIFESGTN